MSRFTRQQVEKAVKAKGYVWFEDSSNKGYDINIVGIRNSEPGSKVTNLFDDWLTLTYKINGVWQYHEWEATTDPGKKGVVEYKNPNGVAILVPGQYRRSHTIGLHQGKYQALRQQSNVKVYRDSNRNLTFDLNKIQEGIFGINIHKAGQKSTWVENWSEGCQVFRMSKDFDTFMSICRQARTIHGNSFSYTLIESKDII
jgi:hypothetical protein